MKNLRTITKEKFGSEHIRGMIKYLEYHKCKYTYETKFNENDNDYEIISITFDDNSKPKLSVLSDTCFG